MEGQYHFDFEIDSSEVDNCYEGDTWEQVPGQRWCCDFLNPLEGASSLHHCYDNPEEGCDYLVLRCDALHTDEPFSFSFRIKHAFDPSSQNNWQLVLGAHFDEGLSTGGAAPEILSGLILGVNYTGSDDLVKIWYVEGVKCHILCSTSLDYQEEIGTGRAPLFHLEGKGDGRLDLYWSPDPLEQEEEYLASCSMEGVSWGRHVLLRYRYTSFRDRALWLDQVDFTGNFEKDTLAPEVIALEPVAANVLELNFSEQVVMGEESLLTLFREATGEATMPDSLAEIERGILIFLNENIPNREMYQLRVEGFRDLDGNLLRDTLVAVMRNEAQWGDVVFNEVMADPDPPVAYSREYLELFKRSAYRVDLKGWRLVVNERTYLLDDLDAEGAFRDELLVLKGITLPNTGALLSLYSKEGALIHAASYRIPWDGPDWKKQGGWSLESPDPEQVCRISYNWEFSGDTAGGTPGRINSNRTILVDSKPPVLLYAGLAGPGDLILADPGVKKASDHGGGLLLHYSEPLILPANAGTAIRIGPDGVFPDSVLLQEPLQDVLKVHFPVDLQNRARYTLFLSGFCDCAGNCQEDLELVAGAISKPEQGDILINEIMFDPDEGKPEFVELYLPGERFMDLKDLAIHLVGEGDPPDKPLVLSSHSRLFLPGQYLVLTDCVPCLEKAYGLGTSGQWVEIEGWTEMKNSSGSIYLTDRAGQVVDVAGYSRDMHMELLDDPTGVSLERISTEQSGNIPDNWHSAASISGYATPGRENSQTAGETLPDHLLEVYPEVFSPDNDGNNDLLNIVISPGGNSWVISLVITDLLGKAVRVLANNQLAGPVVTYTWDGEGENGEMQDMGFYVIHAHAYSPLSGEQWIRRKAVGLVYR